MTANLNNHQFTKNPLAGKTEAQMEYDQYLKTHHWKAWKQVCRDIYIICLYPACEYNNFDTAHKHYTKRYAETIFDLLLLCHRHHMIFDGNPDCFALDWIVAKQEQAIYQWMDTHPTETIQNLYYSYLKKYESEEGA